MENLRWNSIVLVIGLFTVLKQVEGNVFQSIQVGTEPDIYSEITQAKNKLIDWFLKRKKNDSFPDKWGYELPRIVTALYLADESIFVPGNKEGDEMRYELIIQLLTKLSRNNTIGDQELALYIHALTVACFDPRNFFGHDLVSKLLAKVKMSEYKDPFALLVLCNTGEDLDDAYKGKLERAFESTHRAFWIDTEAIAVMALQCISFRSKVWRRAIDKEMKLAKQYFRNETIGNPISTALIVQASLNDLEYFKDFNLLSAYDVILKSQKPDGSWGSIRNSYYVLPVLNYKSLVNISTDHCRKTKESGDEATTELQETRDEEFIVHYTVLFGEEFDLARTWRVMVSGNNTFYDVIEIVNNLDPKHNVKYNMVKGKPYVSALYEKEDDVEFGLYWFTYIRPSLLKKKTPILITISPADVNLQPNKELILWYRQGKWTGYSPETAF